MARKQGRLRIYCGFCENEFLDAFDQDGYARCSHCAQETLDVATFRSRFPQGDLWKTIRERCGCPGLDKLFCELSNTGDRNLELEFWETMGEGENVAGVLKRVTKGWLCFWNLDERVDVAIMARLTYAPQKWVAFLAQAGVLPAGVVEGKYNMRLEDIIGILDSDFDTGFSRSALQKVGRDLVGCAAKFQSLRTGDLPLYGLQDPLICVDRILIANYRIREAKLTGALPNNAPLYPVPYFPAAARLHITRRKRDRTPYEIFSCDELVISLYLDAVDSSLSLLLFAILDHIDEDGKYDFSAFILDDNEVKRYIASKDVLPDMLKAMQDDDGAPDISEEAREQFANNPQKFVIESYLDVAPIMMSSDPESAPRNFPAALAQIASVVSDMLADGTCPDEWAPWEDYLKNFVALSTKQSGE